MMEFRIADTFTDSLARLTGEEQKLVKTTAFDLQLNLAGTGLQFHKLDKARDKNFWSVRVGSDLRLIVHRTESSLLLCYVDHHDPAYRWAERRKLETHPKTGAAQLVEIRETVQEIAVPKYIDAPVVTRKPRLFEKLSDDELLGYGVPAEWLADVRKADEDAMLVLADHLPAEAAEALLELATGGKPASSKIAASGANPFEHPDAQRRFRIMGDMQELQRALEYPWDKWTIFLHPQQRQWVERQYSGPARVSGSAGTGKTIVALHRAVYLARHNPDSRVLLATFSDTLANALRGKLRRLISNEPRLGERLDVYAMNAIGRRLYELHFGRARIAASEQIAELLKDAAATLGVQRFTPRFLMTEWSDVVDAGQLESWEAYRDFKRLGRKTRLPEPQRAELWQIFEAVLSKMREQELITYAGLFNRLAAKLATIPHPPFEFAVIDEAQDISIAQLKFLAAMGGQRPESLFFAGDLGQRIFQTPFSWKAAGVDIRGRARTLNINYRTSHQIRRQADRLLEPAISDVDGNNEDRGNTISVFNGTLPSIKVLQNRAEEIKAIIDWLQARQQEGILPHEMGIFVRSTAELSRAREAVEQAGLPFKVLDDNVETVSGYTAISTMHLAKGLEFRVVVVMACDDEVIPLQSRIEAIADDADLEEVYNTERHLLYVACTRARDHLMVTGVEPPSEFLGDLQMKS